MNKAHFLEELNRWFKVSNDCFGETISDVRIRVYTENPAHIDVVVWCNLVHKGRNSTTEFNLRPEGTIMVGGIRMDIFNNETAEWRKKALDGTLESTELGYVIPFNE